MYYFIYGFLYLVSLLPFFILYRISDAAYGFMYYITGYRKKIVMQNLEIAFPGKTMNERKRIARHFYRNLTDTFVETIKLISISDSEFSKRAVMNLENCNKLLGAGKNIQLHSGHQMNWEYAGLALSKYLNIPPVKVYMKINYKPAERLFYKIRSKYKGVLVAAQGFKTQMHRVLKNQYTLALIADQSPANPHFGYWLNFFSKPVAFLTIPDKAARRNNPAIVFVNFIKIKRGYYKFDFKVITENGNEFTEGELVVLFRDFLEKNISRQPENYLWSHRRWKFDYKKDFEKKWIDRIPPPAQ